MRAAGRGNSLAEPQLATQVFTSSSGTAARVTFESIEPAAVLGDIRPRNIDHEIQQRDGFREHRGDILPALVSHFAQARIGVGVDIQARGG